MKTTVTGANGFIGSNLVRDLLKDNKEIKAIIKPETQRNTLVNLDIEIVEADIRDEDALKNALKDSDELYHLAAHNKLWASHPSIFLEVNTKGTINVLKAAAANEVKRVVHTSTCDILGIEERREGKEGTEDDFPDMSALPGPYGRSKFLAEQEAQRYANNGLECVIVSPTIPIGAYDTTPTEPGKLIRTFLEGRLKAYVNRTMNFTCVKDCARGLILAMKKGRSGERYIIGGSNITLEAFLSQLGRLTGIARPKSVPYGVARIASSFMERLAKINRKEPMASVEGMRLIRYSFAFSSRKARSELGYLPNGIEEALESAVDWHRQYTR